MSGVAVTGTIASAAPRPRSTTTAPEYASGARLDRLTHRCEIFEMNGESYRFRESMTAKQQKDPKKGT